MDLTQIVTTVLSLTSGAIASLLIYRNTRQSNRTQEENSFIDQLQEQIQSAENRAEKADSRASEAFRQAADARDEAAEARDESAKLRRELARMSTFAWQLYDHINRGSPPPPPEWPNFAREGGM